ncbi:MAG: hypothetical protein M3384_08525 [Acidobacteriota bacterium]|nr:hypothetical protein [Acidobacteriota bacterium]
MTRLVFGGVIAVILLVLYGYSIYEGIKVVQECAQTTCDEDYRNLSPGITTILNLVGGLISALVIAVLAVSDPKELPGRMFIANAGAGGDGRMAIDGSLTEKVVNAIAIAYIVCWVICGLAAVIYGFIQHSETVPPLTAAAKSWLGIAIAAAYAFLKIEPGK